MLQGDTKVSNFNVVGYVDPCVELVSGLTRALENEMAKTNEIEK